jgi:hypothetical protein
VAVRFIRFFPVLVLCFLSVPLTAAAQVPPAGTPRQAIEPPAPVPPAVHTRDAEGRSIVRATRLANALDCDGQLDDTVYGNIPLFRF